MYFKLIFLILCLILFSYIHQALVCAPIKIIQCLTAAVNPPLFSPCRRRHLCLHTLILTKITARCLCCLITIHVMYIPNKLINILVTKSLQVHILYFKRIFSLKRRSLCKLILGLQVPLFSDNINTHYQQTSFQTPFP